MAVSLCEILRDLNRFASRFNLGAFASFALKIFDLIAGSANSFWYLFSIRILIKSKGFWGISTLFCLVVHDPIFNFYIRYVKQYTLSSLANFYFRSKFFWCLVVYSFLMLL